MPRRRRSFAQEIGERIAAGDVANEEAARVAVAHDIATGRLGCRCNFEKGIPGTSRRLEFGIAIEPEFVPVRLSAARSRYLWQQIRAGKPVQYSPDNETITAGWLRIVDIVVWDRVERAAVSAATRVPPGRRELPAHGAARKPEPAPRAHGALTNPKRQPGDTDKARGELLYQAAKKHIGSITWSTDTAFAAARDKFPDNPLLEWTSVRTMRKAWLYAKRKLREGA